ncbi:MAG: polyphosphate kinase 2 [Pseudomonadota bacterium]
MSKPFDAAVTRFFEEEAPEDMRKAIEDSKKKDVLTDDFPYDRWMNKDDYEDALHALQIELVKMQAWARETGARIVAVFEGRDAAGKGGTIRRLRENLSPRSAKVVALSKPTETESGEWYFQRYARHLPTAGQIAIYDRSWYNRAVVEHVFGFCTAEERHAFFQQLPNFERLLVDDGIVLVKLWLNVGRAEQLRRMLARESDPLKHWKLSPIDVQGLGKWDDYTAAIGETLEHASFDFAPWTVVRSDDKRRARLNAIRAVLHAIPYADRDAGALAADDEIVGGPDLWLAGA